MSLSRQSFVLGSTAFASIAMITQARAAEFDFKFGLDLPQEHPVNVRATEAFARITKATNGRFQAKTFPASVLGSDASMISQLRSGAIEMLAMPGAFLTFSPVAGIENLAFAFKDSATVFRAMDGDLGKVIRDDIASKGVVCMDKIWESGFRNITSSVKPIHNAADLAGLKIRVSPGKIRIDTFQSLGASPTPIALSELYTSLQTHVVDAQENPLVLINQQKFFEVQKYVSLSEHIWSGYWTLVNADVWKRMGPGVQAIFTRELNASTTAARNDMINLNAAVTDQLTRRGMKFNTVDKQSFKQKLSDAKYYDRWKTEFGAPAWTALEKYGSKLG
jgi:tripartite ATP-independent transporter DctP family solute receptor